jgi:hypothetical protein
MKTYRVITKTEVILVKADSATIGDANKLIFFWDNEVLIAAFNVDEIYGFIQVDNLGA